MIAQRCATQASRFHGAHWRVRALVATAVGFLAACGQAPIDAWWLSIPAFAVLMAFVATAATPKRAFGVMWWAGLGYFAFALRWIVEPFLVDAATTGWMAPFAIVLMASGAALFWGAAGWLSVRFATPRLPGLVLTLTLTEATRSLILTGFPWALVGHVWIGTGVMQAAAWIGPHGLTLLALLAAWGLMRAAFGQWQMLALPAAVAALGLALTPGAPDAESGPIVRLVQPNVPQDQKWDPIFRVANAARLLDLTSAEPAPDLIVWPETAVPVLMQFAEEELANAAEAARGVPLILGLNRGEGGRYYNSLLHLGPGAEVRGVYDKAHLAPFGEYIPGGEWLARFGIRGLAASEGAAFTPGGVQPLMDIPGIGPARVLICYEGIFAEEIGHADRPRLMILITNDAWFGNGAGPEQHLAQARLRAVEQGLPMARAANTGISAMIDAKGRVTGALPLNEAGKLDVPLPKAHPPTIYSRTGDLPVLVLAILSLLLCAGRTRGRT